MTGILIELAYPSKRVEATSFGASFRPVRREHCEWDDRRFFEVASCVSWNPLGSYVELPGAKRRAAKNLFVREITARSRFFLESENV